MKTAVLANDLSTADVLDNRIYQEYLKQLTVDIKEIFSVNGFLVEVDCPGCGEHDGNDVYTKMGMQFQECPFCHSHYVNPRPDLTAHQEFYKDSKACQFWRGQISDLEDSQLYYIYGSRINWISELVDEYFSDAGLLMDFETKYPFLLKHIAKEKMFKKIAALDPQLYERMNDLTSDIVVEDLQGFKGQVDVFTAFETIERMFDPQEAFDLAAKFCKPGGLFLLTAASCTGFEYQVLGKNAPNINPINRMNLLSIEAIMDKIKDAGFEVVELSTPGRLDVNIVKETIKKSEDLNIDPFWKYIFRSRDEKTWDGLQKFLQENRLSSHVRIAAKKNS